MRLKAIKLRDWSVIALAATVVASTPISGSAQSSPSMNYTSFDATSGTPVQLGYYGAAHKNCSPAALPEIQVIEAPKSGLLTIRRGELTTSKVAGCPGLKMPAQVVFYLARDGSVGSDHLVYAVKNEGGAVAAYDVTITIKPGPKPTDSPKPGDKI
jgi:hypothetical protein